MIKNKRYKNCFERTEVLKNLARYKAQDNFVRQSK